MTEEDEAFDEIARKQSGGFMAKRAMAADKVQDETDMLTIAYLDGYERGKKEALAQPAQEPVAEVAALMDALTEIAYAGMSSPPDMSEDARTAWHASQAWRFIGIAARAIDQESTPAPVQKDSCFCHDGASLQMVSGGAAPEGYLGKVTLLIDEEYIDYVKAQPAQEPVAYVTEVYGGRFTFAPLNPAMVLPVGMAFYAGPA